MSDAGGSWEHVGRMSVADRIDRNGEEVVGEFNAVAAQVRRGEPIAPDDVDRLRRELEHAEHLLDDILEPIARGEAAERVYHLGVDP